ncbi:hypothetical protein PMAYCL1PPCAC_05827, partial [Pristionchus mayeri]
SDREANLRRACEYATEIASEDKPSLTLAEEILLRMARVVADGLDCSIEGKVFYSTALRDLSGDIGDYVNDYHGSKVAKFAFAFTTLLNELNESMIGPKPNTDVLNGDGISEDVTEPTESDSLNGRSSSAIDCPSGNENPLEVESVEQPLPLFQDCPEEVKNEELEESIDIQDDFEEVKKEELEEPIDIHDDFDIPTSSAASNVHIMPRVMNGLTATAATSAAKTAAAPAALPPPIRRWWQTGQGNRPSSIVKKKPRLLAAAVAKLNQVPAEIGPTSCARLLPIEEVQNMAAARAEANQAWVARNRDIVKKERLQQAALAARKTGRSKMQENNQYPAR